MNKQQYNILEKGVLEWNAWRRDNPLAVIDLSNADLSGVDLDGANLSYADLSGAKLANAFLPDAYMRNSDLRGAYLSGARMGGANLRHINLIGADLSRARMGEANLRHAYLSHTGLSRATGNMREVRSIHCFEEVVTYTAEKIIIRRYALTIEQWFAITDEELNEMHPVIRDCWRKWEPIIKAIIAAYPATPTGCETNRGKMKQERRKPEERW